MHQGNNNAGMRERLSGSDSESAEEIGNKLHHECCGSDVFVTNGNTDLNQAMERPGISSNLDTNQVELEIGGDQNDIGQSNKGEKRTLDTIVQLGSETSESSTDENSDGSLLQVMLSRDEQIEQNKRQKIEAQQRSRKISMPAKSYSSTQPKKESPRRKVGLVLIGIHCELS